MSKPIQAVKNHIHTHVCQIYKANPLAFTVEEKWKRTSNISSPTLIHSPPLLKHNRQERKKEKRIACKTLRKLGMRIGQGRIGEKLTKLHAFEEGSKEKMMETLDCFELNSLGWIWLGDEIGKKKKCYNSSMQGEWKKRNGIWGCWLIRVNLQKIENSPQMSEMREMTEFDRLRGVRIATSQEWKT